MRSLPFLALVLGASLVAPRLSAAPTDITRAREQFVDFYPGKPGSHEGNLSLKSSNEPSPDVARALHFARTLEADGRWPDINYASKAHSGWPPDLHWNRIVAMVAAARLSDSPETRASLNAAVHRAFAYWIRHDFICPNWWYNQIGVPQQAATAALLLGDGLRPDERRYLLTTMMPRAKIAMTGQNRVWLAGNTLMAALLEGDEPLAKTAADTIWSQVVSTTEEGIQPDSSFHQHGPQQQFGNYGLALAVEVCRWATVLRGTPWAMPTDRLATYRSFLLDGEAWTVWRNFMDVAACGRQLMPHSQHSKAVTIGRVMHNAQRFDPAYAADYRAFLARNGRPDASNDLVGTRVFWRSDYVVCRRPEFAATLKMSSRRVVGAEMVNHENLLGYHEADGALYLYRRGDEYADIFPVWDWQKLPGTTCAQSPDGPPAFRQVRGERAFVGGVTDGQDACAVLDYARKDAVAHKAWVFAGDAIVCLGNSIRSPTGLPVVTTLNQCLLHGPVTIKQAGRAPATFAGGEATLESVEWVEHDGWRYSFPTPATVHLSAGPQSGNWNRVFRNPDTPRADVMRQVFSLWIAHTRSDDTYAYVIAPARAAAASGARILANTRTLQTVALQNGKIAIAFWSAGQATLPDGRPVSADHPCLLLLDHAHHLVTVTDPTHGLTRLTLQFNGTPRTISLPKAGDAGCSVCLRYN